LLVFSLHVDVTQNGTNPRSTPTLLVAVQHLHAQTSRVQLCCHQPFSVPLAA
jgi:hypothetical protein